MSVVPHYECDACGQQTDGYAAKELLAEGWAWHDIAAGQHFVMCGLCMEMYAERRRLAGVESK